LEALPFPIISPILVTILLFFLGFSFGNVLPLPFSIPILVAAIRGELFALLWGVRHVRLRL